ncbi:MAG: SoxR reducing system RseC family protein [Bacteroidales bacterium]|nr:SoxR reducing system RseC family protein [Bacteroidales bacterium]
MQQINHTGTVLSVHDGCVEVGIKVTSACAHCEAHAHCGMAEGQEKRLNVYTPDWQDYAAGDSVNVAISDKNGLQAVLLAYVLPAFVILAAFAGLYTLHLSEVVTALITLSIAGIYALALYLCRGRLQKKFAIKIAHI